PTPPHQPTSPPPPPPPPIAPPPRQTKSPPARGAPPARRAPLDDERRPPQRGSADSRCYLTSALAPACSSFSLAAFASSLFTPSLTALGAASTRSLASLSPRLVSSRTALITWILFGPISVSMTLNSVCSSSGGAASAPPPAAAGAAPPIITGAAAVTPKRSSSALTSSDSSSTLICSIAPISSSFVSATSPTPLDYPLP